jgi:Mg/Co/Ni transporter MgtE
MADRPAVPVNRFGRMLIDVMDPRVTASKMPSFTPTVAVLAVLAVLVPVLTRSPGMTNSL